MRSEHEPPDMVFQLFVAGYGISGLFDVQPIEELSYCFPKWLSHFMFPPAVHKVPDSYTCFLSFSSSQLRGEWAAAHHVFGLHFPDPQQVLSIVSCAY